MQTSSKDISFSQVYTDYKHKIYSYVVYRVNNDKEQAEDIVSTVFLKAYENFDSYDDRYAISTWLYRIARNTVIDYYRTKKITYELEEEYYTDHSDPLVYLLERKLTLSELETSLNKLPPTQANFIRQQFFQGYSAKEIAASADTTHAAVRKQISRGLSGLREALLAILMVIVNL